MSGTLDSKNLREVRGSYLEEDLWLPRRPQHVRLQLRKLHQRRLLSANQQRKLLQRKLHQRRRLLSVNQRREKLLRKLLQLRRLPSASLLSAKLLRRQLLLHLLRRLPSASLLSVKLQSVKLQRSKFPLLHGKTPVGNNWGFSISSKLIFNDSISRQFGTR